MARLPRFVLPGIPQHVIQRGNNRQRILLDEDDYWYLWERLCVAALRCDCAIHAYVLMPDHFHLLLTADTEPGIGKLMQSVGRYYVQYFNHRYGRTGTLWEGRYRATLVDPEAFLLPVSRYIESNPVRGGLVAEPGDYDWSSHGCNALGREDALLTPHPAYLALGGDLADRAAHYREQTTQPLDPALVQRIRDTTNKAWVLGDATFCSRIESHANRRARPRPRGGDRRSLAYRQHHARATSVTGRAR